MRQLAYTVLCELHLRKTWRNPYCFHHGGTQSQQRQSASSIGNQNDLQLYQRHQGCLCNA